MKCQLSSYTQHGWNCYSKFPNIRRRTNESVHYDGLGSSCTKHPSICGGRIGNLGPQRFVCFVHAITDLWCRKTLPSFRITMKAVPAPPSTRNFKRDGFWLSYDEVSFLNRSYEEASCTLMRVQDFVRTKNEKVDYGSWLRPKYISSVRRTFVLPNSRSCKKFWDEFALAVVRQDLVNDSIEVLRKHLG